MKKLTLAILSFALLSACSRQTRQDEISHELGIEIKNASEVSAYDTHSGNGDGESIIILNFENSDTLNEIKENSEWNEFPLDETAETIAYGHEEETFSISPFFVDSETAENLIPDIQNGYYILIDRQTNAEDNILERASYNFTLGIYDTDNNNLYFCKLDT